MGSWRGRLARLHDSRNPGSLGGGNHVRGQFLGQLTPPHAFGDEVHGEGKLFLVQLAALVHIHQSPAPKEWKRLSMNVHTKI